MMVWFLLVALFSGVAVGQPAPADDPNHDHVRVILDTSCSMSTSVGGRPPADVQRRAILSVLLLFDLVNPNLGAGDEESFVVFPFDPAWPWAPGSGKAPEQTSRLDVAKLGGRSGLVRALDGIKSESRHTYFSPGVKRAVRELKDTPGGIEDRRVIVIVTDGYPDKNPDEELDRLVTDLRPQLAEHGINVFVLAFGKGITTSGGTTDQAFFKTFLETPGHEIGKLWVDPDGEELLQKMAELFAEAFGYSVEKPRTIGSGQNNVDLAGGPNLSPLEVMLVGYHERPAEPEVLLPGAPGILRPDRVSGIGVRSAHAYSLLTMARPPYHGGAYRVEGTAAASFVVLRKTLLTIETRDPRGATIPKVMMNDKLELEVLARPGAKRVGDTPEVEPKFEVHLGAPAGHSGHLKVHDRARATDRGKFDSIAGVRTYTFSADFQREDPRPEEARTEVYYQAFVIARAYRRKAFIAAAEPLRVHVYPAVDIAPDPPLLPMMPVNGIGAVGPRETGCGTFVLEMLPERRPLPDLGRGAVHPLEIRIAAGTKMDGPLKDAGITVDGELLDLEGAVARGGWSGGRLLTHEEWFDTKHEVCVATGPYRSAGGEREIRLRFTLAEPPYDQFEGVIADLKLNVDLKDPPALALAMWWLLPLLLLLASLLAWLLTRHRPDVPDDFGYGLAPIGSPQGSWSWRALEKQLHWPWSTPVYRVLHPGSVELLGTLIPETSELYRFTPAPGTDWAHEDGLLHAGQGYELSTGGVGYILRLDYIP